MTKLHEDLNELATLCEGRKLRSVIQGIIRTGRKSTPKPSIFAKFGAKEKVRTIKKHLDFPYDDVRTELRSMGWKEQPKFHFEKGSEVITVSPVTGDLHWEDSDK